MVTISRVLEYAEEYLSGTRLSASWETGLDGASRIARELFDRATDIRFFVGCAMNPAHQNPKLSLAFGAKFQLIDRPLQEPRADGQARVRALLLSGAHIPPPRLCRRLRCAFGAFLVQYCRKGEETMEMEIGSVIRRRRAEMGVTQEEMADRLGVTASAVNKWGERQVSAGHRAAQAHRPAAGRHHGRAAVLPRRTFAGRNRRHRPRDGRDVRRKAVRRRLRVGEVQAGGLSQQRRAGVAARSGPGRAAAGAAGDPRRRRIRRAHPRPVHARAGRGRRARAPRRGRFPVFLLYAQAELWRSGGDARLLFRRKPREEAPPRADFRGDGPRAGGVPRP